MHVLHVEECLLAIPSAKYPTLVYTTYHHVEFFAFHMHTHLYHLDQYTLQVVHFDT